MQTFKILPNMTQENSQYGKDAGILFNVAIDNKRSRIHLLLHCIPTTNNDIYRVLLCLLCGTHTMSRLICQKIIYVSHKIIISCSSFLTLVLVARHVQCSTPSPKQWNIGTTWFPSTVL